MAVSIFFSQFAHRASDRQNLAAEWVNLPACSIVICDSTQDSYQSTGLVPIKGYQSKAKFTPHNLTCKILSVQNLTYYYKKVIFTKMRDEILSAKRWCACMIYMYVAWNQLLLSAKIHNLYTFKCKIVNEKLQYLVMVGLHSWVNADNYMYRLYVYVM